MALATSAWRDILPRAPRIQASRSPTRDGSAPAERRRRCSDRQTIDRALGIEDGVDPPHGLDRERRLAEFGQLEEVAPAMRPASASVNGPGFRPSDKDR